MNQEAKTQWLLIRQDDNGNREVMEVFTDEGEAKDRLAEFEKKHHKQTYWIEPG